MDFCVKFIKINNSGKEIKFDPAKYIRLISTSQEFYMDFYHKLANHPGHFDIKEIVFKIYKDNSVEMMINDAQIIERQPIESFICTIKMLNRLLAFFN